MRHLLLILLVCFGLKSTAQVEVTTVGTDFWFAFMQNANDNVPTFSVFISSQEFASGTVEMPLTGWSEDFVVVPGVTTTVEVPLTAEHLNSGVIENKGIHVTTDNPVSVYCINYSNFTSDGTRILPKQFLDIEYVVSGYVGLSGFSIPYMSELIVVATEDDTEVVITPACDMLGNLNEGTEYTIQLNQGETYQLQAADPDFDITGTSVVATPESGECRPFAVFGGSECPYIPVGCNACDHIFDQTLPAAIWGDEYFTVPFSGSNSYTYRVLAIEDGTEVSVDGVPTYTLDANEFVEVNAEPEPLYITSNNPTSVIQYMEGTSCSGFGDPAMLTLNATNQTMDEVTFATVVSTIIVNHNLNIVVESTASGSVFLDGVLIAPAEFTQFPGNPAYSYAQLTINQGSHTIQCDERFVAYAYGTGNAESYAYSTGAKALEPLEPVINVTCSDGQVILQSEENYTSAWWSTESEPEDTVHIGQPFIINPPIPNEVYILHGNDFLSGCSVEEFFSVESPEELTVNIIEDMVELCLYQEYAFDSEVDPPGDDYTYNWSSEGAFIVNGVPNGVISPFESGYYYLDVSTLSGCSEGRDSVLVEIIGDEVTFFDAVTDEDGYCEGDTVFFNAVTGINIDNELFNTSPLSGMWADLQGEALSNVCGSMSGNALYFEGAANRWAETVDYDMSEGGLISFAIMISDGSASCDGTEFGENVILEYSIDGGGAWTEVQTMFEGVYPNFTNIQVEVPLAAQTTATRFRWIQPVFSGLDEDIWMLDNVAISSLAPTGEEYLWYGQEAVSDDQAQAPYVVPTMSGWYYVELDAFECPLIDSVFVELQSNFTLTVSNDTTLCTPDDVQLNVEASPDGDYTYLWDNAGTLNSAFIPSPTASPLISTTYTVEVTSSAGCVNEADVTITLLSFDAPTITADNTSICAGSAELTANVGGLPEDFQYSWSPSEFVDDPNAQIVNVTPPSTTTFEVLITDTINDCSSSVDILITVNSASIDLPEDTVLCDSQGLQLVYPYESSGVQSFSWNSSDLSNPNTAYPFVEIPDMNQTLVVTMYDFNYDCEVTDTIVVSTESLTYSAADVLSICPDNTLQYEILGDYNSITWQPSANLNDSDPAEPIFSNQEAEMFYYEMESSLGCIVEDSIEIIINLPFSFEIVGDTLCNGESIVLDNPLSGFEYLWSTAEVTEDISVSDAGIYTLQVSDSAGCSISDNIIVDVEPLPVFEIIGDLDLCIGEMTTLTADITTVESYEWNNGADEMIEDFNLIGPQVIWAEVTDIMGCVFRDSVEAIWRNPPPLALSFEGAICEDTGTVVSAEAEFVQYLWETGADSSSIFVEEPGYYSVTITDLFNCVNEDSIFVNQIIFPLAQNLDTFYCEGSSVTIRPEIFPGFDISWSTGFQEDTLLVNIEGDYQMILTNENCIKKFPFEVLYEENPELSITRDSIFCELDLYAGLGYPLYATSNGTVEWMNGLEQDTIFEIFEEGEYLAIAYSELGCPTEQAIYVPSICLPHVYAPSAFTPDDDGVNDHWQVVVTGQLDEFELRVFDRWGDEIFKTNDPDQHWNGSVRGGDYYADDDVYHYVIKYEVWENVPELISGKYVGTVTLIR